MTDLDPIFNQDPKHTFYQEIREQTIIQDVLEEHYESVIPWIDWLSIDNQVLVWKYIESHTISWRYLLCRYPLPIGVQSDITGAKAIMDMLDGIVRSQQAYYSTISNTLIDDTSVFEWYAGQINFTPDPWGESNFEFLFNLYATEIIPIDINLNHWTFNRFMGEPNASFHLPDIVRLITIHPTRTVKSVMDYVSDSDTIFISILSNPNLTQMLSHETILSITPAFIKSEDLVMLDDEQMIKNCLGKPKTLNAIISDKGSLVDIMYRSSINIAEHLTTPTRRSVFAGTFRDMLVNHPFVFAENYQRYDKELRDQIHDTFIPVTKTEYPDEDWVTVMMYVNRGFNLSDNKEGCFDYGI